MSPAPEFLPYESLPLPCLVTQGERIAYANPALARLLGMDAQAVTRTATAALLARFAATDDAGWLNEENQAHARGEATPGEVWVRMTGADGVARQLLVRRADLPRADHTLYVLLDGDADAHARRLTGALVGAAGELLRCRDEGRVLELAADAVHAQGFRVTVMLLRDGRVTHGPVRMTAEDHAHARQVLGRPLSEVSFGPEDVPHVFEAFASRRANFVQDVHRLVEKLHPPEVAARVKREMPVFRSLEAPVYVEDQPYALFTIQGGEALTPAAAAALELFARLVGGALESARHHRAAERRLEELKAVQAELVDQERLAVLGEASAVVAHEVRNPLGAILNAIAVLRRERGLSGAGGEAVGMIEEEALRLESVVRDLLDVVRPLEPRPRAMSLVDLVRRTLETCVSRGLARAEQLRLEVADGVGGLEADEALLQLALENLVRNALQAGPSGGEVKVRLEPRPGGVSLAVEDAGPGVPEADAARVFEPFFTTRANGTGLGLAVVRRVVTAHGGSVRVGPRAGGGARFELVLPATAP